MMNEQYQRALAQAERLCADNNARLLYLSVFGSTLYGTATESSDLDFRGVFMPSIQSIVLGKAKKSLRYSTGLENSRNSSKDLDIDLWSLENWLLHLLPEGDTGAVDLLFSPSNSACTLMRSPLLDTVFSKPILFLDMSNNKAMIKYCYSQAKKYGIKGSRLGALRLVQKWLDTHAYDGILENILDKVAVFVANDKYCFILNTHEGKALSLCGKIHLGTIKMEEFRKRVARDLERYGKRAREAEKNQGLDFKALSHALRAIDQMEELLLNGKIVYPLASRERLLQVKKGEIAWKELEELILTRLAHAERLHESRSCLYQYDREYVEKFLLQCYALPLES